MDDLIKCSFEDNRGECNYRAPDFSDLYTHFRYTHTLKKFTRCPFCFKIFASFRTLKKHVDLFHLNIILLVCDFQGCPFTTYNPNSLRTHKRIHKRPKKYACSICKTEFEILDEVAEHKRLHTECKNAICVLLTEPSFANEQVTVSATPPSSSYTPTSGHPGAELTDQQGEISETEDHGHGTQFDQAYDPSIPLNVYNDEVQLERDDAALEFPHTSSVYRPERISTVRLDLGNQFVTLSQETAQNWASQLASLNNSIFIEPVPSQSVLVPVYVPQLIQHQNNHEVVGQHVDIEQPENQSQLD